jgi:gliding motility-associated-like protein
VCVGQEVTVRLNSAISGKNFYWSFCSGNATDAPFGINLGNPSGNFFDPKSITLIADVADCFSFTTSAGDSSVIRNYHGYSFINPPSVSKKWSGLAGLTRRVRGIQIVSESGLWYGYVTSGNTLLGLRFGPNIKTGDPQVMFQFTSPSVASYSDLKMVNDGGTWVGFATDSTGNTLHRLLFSSGLQAEPVVFNLGNTGQFNGPAGLSLIKDNNSWHIFIVNETNSTLSRLDFGSSLTNNNPTGINLGNPGGLLNSSTGITLTGDCLHVDGLVANHLPSGNQLIHLRFGGGAAGAITALTLGGTGALDRPYGISNFRRSGDSLFAAVTNSGNSTLSVLWFPECSDASRPGDTLRDPPPYYYLYPGNYNINLSYTGTGASQVSQGICKPIVAMPVLEVSLGADKHICNGGSAILSADSVYTTYLWSTGSIAPSISTGTAGTYYLDVTNRWGCTASDTVLVTVGQGVEVTVDTTICYGERYFAQGNWQTTSGTYYDSLQTIAGCDSLITTQLSVTDKVIINLGNDTTICPGGQILLDATTPYASSYLWQDGSKDSLYLVTENGLYWVHVNVDGCIHGDTISILSCPPQLWFPNAFTPNNDGLNDFFRPTGVSISRFHMLIFDRWGTKISETTDITQGWNGMSKGEYCPPGTYTYMADYEVIEEPGETKKVTGTFTLVR